MEWWRLSTAVTIDAKPGDRFIEPPSKRIDVRELVEKETQDQSILNISLGHSRPPLVSFLGPFTFIYTHNQGMLALVRIK
jgi:hypothetical protein